MRESGPIRLVINVYEELDDSEIVALLASKEERGKGYLSDATWFMEDVFQCGIAYLLGMEDWKDIKPGLWVAVGYSWAECLQTVNGDEYDGGFEVERAEPLTDLQDLIYDWMGDSNDYWLIENLRSELFSPDANVKKKAVKRLFSIQESLNVLEFVGIDLAKPQEEP